MRRSLPLCVNAVFLVGCVPLSPAGEISVADVFVEGDTFVYRGTISRESNDRLFELAETVDSFPSTFVITSKGGETFAGIDLGRWVFRNNLNVTVTEYCMSSCANYVFPAGDKKTLESTAALAWHGGSLQEEWNDPCSDIPNDVLEQGLRCADIKKLQRENLEEFKSAEASFYAEIGVDQRMTILGQDPRFDCRENSASLGWDYSIEDMERLGIENVQVNDGEWRPKLSVADLTVCRVELGPDFF